MKKILSVLVICLSVHAIHELTAASNAFTGAAAMGAGFAVGGAVGSGGAVLVKDVLRHPVDTAFKGYLFTKLARFFTSDKGEKADYIVKRIRSLQDDMNKKAERFDRRKKELLDMLLQFIPWMKRIDTELSSLEKLADITQAVDTDF